MRLSGLEPLNIDDESLFVNVGERNNVTGSAKFKRLIKEDKFAEAINSCAGQQAQTAAAVEGRHGNTEFYECECCAYCQPAGKALAMRIAIFGAGKQAKLAQANA